MPDAVYDSSWRVPLRFPRGVKFTKKLADSRGSQGECEIFLPAVTANFVLDEPDIAPRYYTGIIASFSRRRNGEWVNLAKGAKKISSAALRDGLHLRVWNRKWEESKWAKG